MYIIFGDVTMVNRTIKTNTGKVVVNKTDNETKEPIEGVIFGLYKTDGTEVGRATTNNKGIATFTNLYQNSYVLEDVMIELQDRIEETGEVVSDAVSKVSAGNWWVAIRYDRLPWNFFHNAVQDDIVVKDSSIEKELTINKVEDGIETGKRGRVDLAKGVGNITFFNFQTKILVLLRLWIREYRLLKL